MNGRAAARLQFCFGIVASIVVVAIIGCLEARQVYAIHGRANRRKRDVAAKRDVAFHVEVHTGGAGVGDKERAGYRVCVRFDIHVAGISALPCVAGERGATGDC